MLPGGGDEGELEDVVGGHAVEGGEWAVAAALDVAAGEADALWGVSRG